MESLYTLERFTEKYPQTKRRRLQYAFTGGTGIRLNQEKQNCYNKRTISDFDLVVFENQKYPKHTFHMDERLVSLNKKELKKETDFVSLRNKEYYFMNGSFLTLSKTCAIDPPREKDYSDVKILYDNNLIDEDKLENFFYLSDKLTNNSRLSIEKFKEIMKREDRKNILLFQSFPNYVNLIDEFNSKEKASEIINDYIESEENKSGYALYSILKNSHSLIQKIDKEKDKENLLEKLLGLAYLNTHIEFDRKVHQEFLPQIV